MKEQMDPRKRYDNGQRQGLKGTKHSRERKRHLHQSQPTICHHPPFSNEINNTYTAPVTLTQPALLITTITNLRLSISTNSHPRYPRTMPQNGILSIHFSLLFISGSGIASLQPTSKARRSGGYHGSYGSYFGGRRRNRIQESRRSLTRSVFGWLVNIFL